VKPYKFVTIIISAMNIEDINKFQNDTEELIKHLNHPEDTYHVDIIRQCQCLLNQALVLNQKKQLSMMKIAIKDYALANFSNEPYNISYHLFKVVRKTPKAFDKDESLFFAELLEQSFYKECTASIKGEDDYTSDIHEITEELVRFHHKRKDKDKVREILGTCVNCFEISSSSMPAMRAAIMCHKLVNLANDVSCDAIRNRVSIMMENNGPKIKIEMATISTSISIPSEDIDSIYKACSSNIDPGANFFLLGLLFVPTDAIIQRAFEVSIQSSTIANAFTQIRFNTNGNIASITHPDESSDNLRKILSYVTTTELISPVLHFTINRSIEEGVLNEVKLVDYLSSSPLLDESRLFILQRGINAFLDNDYISSISIFAPQLEEMIRRMYSTLGYSVTSSDSTKTESDTLGRLLAKAPVIIGDRNISKYLSIILSDSRGWNLRNLFCHGLTEAYNWKNADRLFQILLLLSGLRFIPEDGS